jgi:hypothetical protein
VSSNKLNDITIFQLMPSKYNKACNFGEIYDDNCSKYANFIGNLVLIDKKIKDKTVFCFTDRYKLIDHTSIAFNDINTKFYYKEDKLITEPIDEIHWGKNIIISRSQMIADITKFLIIKGNIKQDFFT